MVSSGGIGIVRLTRAKYHPAAMRIELRDANRRRLARVDIDERVRPARVQFSSGEKRGEQDLYLRWDEAVDDSSSLRRCVVCGCGDLYARKSLPQVTPFVVVLAFSGAAVSISGYGTKPIVIASLAILLVVDVLTLLLTRRQLVCYGCGAVYDRLRIARYHKPWDRAISERVRSEPIDLPTVLIEPDGGGAQPESTEEQRQR
jgi:hypothetical protein